MKEDSLILPTDELEQRTTETLSKHDVESLNLFALFKQIQGKAEGKKTFVEYVKGKLGEILEDLQGDSSVATGSKSGRKKIEKRKKDFLEGQFSLYINNKRNKTNKP